MIDVATGTCNARIPRLFTGTADLNQELQGPVRLPIVAMMEEKGRFMRCVSTIDN